MQKKIILAILVLSVVALVIEILWNNSIGATVPSPTTPESSASSSDVLPSSVSKSLPIYTVGEVTWHATHYLNQNITVVGFLLKKGIGYDIVSDEATGTITSHDLSIIGTGITNLQLKQKYILHGTFMNGRPSNSHTLYTLEVSQISQ